MKKKSKSGFLVFPVSFLNEIGMMRNIILRNHGNKYIVIPYLIYRPQRSRALQCFNECYANNVAEGNVFIQAQHSYKMKHYNGFSEPCTKREQV